MKTRKKRLLIVCITTIAALFANGAYYVFFGQEKSWEKLKANQDLNAYEVFSAYAMHTACWMFGWVVDPSTAELAFCKQFHLPYPHIPKFPEDDEYLARVKQNLNPGQSKFLGWKLEKRGSQLHYVTPASILLNGATITCIEKNSEREIYRYDNPGDYAMSFEYIAGIPFCEGLFDYLEDKGILSLRPDVRYIEYVSNKRHDLKLK